ncbi:hypothetical protein RMATCC62417_07015 [Rhizopus microsporus]|nr:hypothetical protein RMATCC62417_07015 [Rhizopus microsporus]
MPSVDNNNNNNNKKPVTLTHIYGTLTTIQSASALAFSTFVLMHGAQVISANVGGAQLANRTLLLTRPIYQDKGIETTLVVGSALVHVASGLAKFSIRLYWKQFGHNTAHPALLPYHRLVGHLQIPVVILHFYLTRLLPIERYGDSSFIDFGYIAWGLQNRPIFTYGLHITLILGSMYHAVSGVNFVFERLFGKKKMIADKTSKVSQHSKSVEQQSINNRINRQRLLKKGAFAALSLGLVSGLVIISRDTTKIPLRFDFESMYSKIVGV